MKRYPDAKRKAKDENPRTYLVVFPTKLFTATRKAAEKRGVSIRDFILNAIRIQTGDK